VSTDTAPKHAGPPPEDRESLFEKIADWVSAAMGRPTNIIVWGVLVLIWVVIFAFGGAHLASGTWMPAWFTSTGFNFPLNLITTVAELFIGFLVAAASNRSERNLDRTLAAIAAQGVKVQETEDRLAAVDAENTELLRQNTDLTQKVHGLVTTVAAQTATLDEIHRHVAALSPQAGEFAPPATADGPVRGGAGSNPANAKGFPAEGPAVPPPAAGITQVSPKSRKLREPGGM
jgi:low affinity Fe/Cu permease